MQAEILRDHRACAIEILRDFVGDYSYLEGRIRFADAMPKSGRAAQAAAVTPAPAIKFRLETPSMFLPFPNDNRAGITLTSSC
jgi:hypothetical protein